MKERLRKRSPVVSPTATDNLIPFVPAFSAGTPKQPDLVSLLTLAEALQHLSQTRESGCLVVSINYQPCQFFVRGGFLIHAISPTHEGESLIGFLLSNDSQAHGWFPHERPVVENLKSNLMSIALQVAMEKDRRSASRAQSSSETISAKPARFYLMGDETKWERLYLTQPVCVLGRGQDCDLIIDHRSISRRHCLFDHVKKGLLVRDLKSTNGTWINGVFAGPESFLEPGDTIHFGECKVLFYREASRRNHRSRAEA